ncbi:hypothetical protein [Flavobacterium sp. DG2-3]|uniref:hypothetical protein n=1 Tax=Flavobacterium sp. DG2-3 TaxID=3068317 RepID=UPI00273E5565|nr:hypothetical protein [Flavobacterium sp. DG2-3]MDP5200909.1 hypothetical protein [Flavobacterium sp. DG2-3]
MKKFLCLFSALTLSLTSCSSDDNGSEEGSAALLPTKITETVVENGKSGTLDYTLTYDGNKLKQISLSDASKSVYTYTGDLITKVEYFKSGVLQWTDVYAYEGTKLVSKITTDAFNTTSQEKLTFVYNANGTVNVNESEIINRQEIKYDTTTLYTFANGNIISTEFIDGVKEKITSTYDDKKSPFVNITGLKLLLDLDNEFDFYSANNALTSVTVTYNADGKAVQTASVDYKLKYNSSNFLSEIFAGDANDSFKVQITY